MGRYAMHSGTLIDITDFKLEDIKLDDIAHHLAKIQRYNGATDIDITYSVGEHCINLANYFLNKGMKAEARIALIHDASEAYLSDIVSPVKQQLAAYQKLEDEVQGEIYVKLLGYESAVAILKNVLGRSSNVNKADKRILIDEVESMMDDEKLEIYIRETGLTKLGCHIEYDNPSSTVKKCFLTMCKTLDIHD